MIAPIPEALKVPFWLAFDLGAGQAVEVTGRPVRQLALVAVALVGWTFLAASCGGLITMSGAHADDWPPGATVALIVLGLVWVGVPSLVFWRRRQRRSP